MSALTLIILAPLLGALVIALTPRNLRFLIRIFACAASLVSLLAAVYVFVNFKTGVAGFQFENAKFPWIESLGIGYHVGVDGVNVGLVLMGAIVAFAAVCVSREIVERHKEYYLLIMLMIGGILGAFASLDMFFFFAFHELALIPTFIMIGVWGRGENRNYATFNITLYLTAGALISLTGLLALYLQSAPRTFDIVELTAQFAAKPISLGNQGLIFPFLLFGFGILVSLWPFHTWAPLGYGAAPTGTAMLHAGVLKKFGLYGLIRIALPMLPSAAQSWMHVVAFLCLGNILFCGLVAMKQRNLNLLIGNSSVAHMGFVFLGVASLTLVGVTGAVVIMVAHGLLAALSFALSGYLYQQTNDLNMDRMGGFLQRMPFIGAAIVMAMMAGCGLPGFANFVGEAMVLFGSWKAYPLVTTLAVWGALVIAAVYMLRAIRSVLHGPLAEKHAKIPDAQGPWRKAPFALLFGSLLLFGVYPSLLTEKIKPSAALIVNMTTGHKEETPKFVSPAKALRTRKAKQ